jgi:hypothetical protein
MNSESVTVLAFKKVLESAGDGMGLARAVAKELRGIRPFGSEAARLILLGFPLPVALRPLIQSGREEGAMLASLIVSAPRSSSTIIGRSGTILAGTLEKWVEARESGTLQQKAMRFRSLVTSGVLGAVTAMIASIGPLVGSLDFNGASTVVDPTTFLYCAAGLTGMSSFMLGLFMSGRGFYLNMAVSLGVFALVSLLASPLATIPSITLWGVK